MHTNTLANEAAPNQYPDSRVRKLWLGKSFLIVCDLFRSPPICHCLFSFSRTHLTVRLSETDFVLRSVVFMLLFVVGIVSLKVWRAVACPIGYVSRATKMETRYSGMNAKTMAGKKVIKWKYRMKREKKKHDGWPSGTYTHTYKNTSTHIQIGKERKNQSIVNNWWWLWLRMKRLSGNYFRGNDRKSSTIERNISFKSLTWWSIENWKREENKTSKHGASSVKSVWQTICTSIKCFANCAKLITFDSPL